MPPKKINKKQKVISVRMSNDMLSEVDKTAKFKKIERTQLIRDAIRVYLDLSPESLEEKIEVLNYRVTQIEETLLLNKDKSPRMIILDQD